MRYACRLSTGDYGSGALHELKELIRQDCNVKVNVVLVAFGLRNVHQPCVLWIVSDHQSCDEHNEEES